MPRGKVAGLLCVGLLAASCTSGRAHPAFRPSFAKVACPADVASPILTPVSCGYLTVLENRSVSTGRTIRLFVTRVDPAGASPRPDPMYVPGSDLADKVNYGGTAPMAERINRQVIIMDQRGTGHSEPNLSCPELDPLAAHSLTVATDNSQARKDFVAAVTACRERLQGRRIDLSAYNLEEMAADAEDLRIVLGIRQWGITTLGTDSRIALEIMRRYPQHIREVVLDGPEFPGVDPFTEAITGTRDVLGQVADACALDRACERSFPDLNAATSQALLELSAKPLKVTVSSPGAGGGGSSVILFDGGMLLRALRQILSDGGSSGSSYLPSALPATVYAALDGRVDTSPGSAAAGMVGDQAYCDGYMPKCTPIHRYAQGAYYSLLCHDLAQSIDRGAILASAGSDAAYGEAFARSPYLDVCSAWGVGEGDPEVARPLSSRIPTLIFLGRFDPYAPSAIVEQAIGGLSRSWVVIDPTAGHNALGSSDCLRTIRASWVENPTSAPTATGCLSGLKLTFEVPAT